LEKGYQEQKIAVDSGYLILYRFDPRLRAEGKNPLQLDSKAPTVELEKFIYNENRYRSLQKAKPELAAQLLELAKKDVEGKYSLMERLAAMEPLADKKD
jgi:pyruvate-ferredoxin/flavodoxin oxidoreductase